MNKKMNNKGFSLVELIVVIAIMGILAVTLAPRLTQYVEKAREANDQNTISEIMTAVKVAHTDYALESALTSYDLGGDAAGTEVMYVTTDGKTWTLNTTGLTAYAPAANDKFLEYLQSILSNFKLQANGTCDNTYIQLTSDADNRITVTLDYDGDVDASGNPAVTTTDRISITE